MPIWYQFKHNSQENKIKNDKEYYPMKTNNIKLSLLVSISWLNLNYIPKLTVFLNKALPKFPWVFRQ